MVTQVLVLCTALTNHTTGPFVAIYDTIATTPILCMEVVLVDVRVMVPGLELLLHVLKLKVSNITDYEMYICMHCYRNILCI